MFEPTSRYAACRDLAMTVKDYQTESQSVKKRGSNERDETEERIIRYKERRFIPSAEKMKTLQEILFTAGDRLDLIASRTLGDPEQFWTRI